MKRLRKGLAWLLCAVMLAGAVAFAGEKVASGQKVSGVETHQENPSLTHGIHREKLGSAGVSAPDNVVVENNALGDGWDGLLSSGEQKTGQTVGSYVEYAQKKNLPPEQVQAGIENIIRGDLPESADIVKAILSNNPGSDTVMALLTAEEAKDYALALLTSLPLPPSSSCP